MGPIPGRSTHQAKSNVALSVDFQDLRLWQAELSLVLVKELTQRAHVHAVIKVDFPLGGMSCFRDGDWLPN